MKITNLKLKNFRNYEDLDISFNENLNIIIGENAQGKTNLIEGLYILGITKSHRTFNDKKIIKDEKEFSKITGLITNNSTKKILEVLISNKGKSVKINGDIKKRTSEYLSNLTVVLFCPDDLEIVKGSPNIRRKFLNIELGQIDNRYLNILNDYNKLIKNRNEYFKQKELNQIKTEYLEVLDKQISEKAFKIYIKRKEFINKLNIKTKEIYKKISNGDDIEIKYETNVDLSEKNLEESIFNKLKSNIKRDIYIGATTIGPHRDDFSFYLNNHKINEYGSQGQQRLAALCLKFAEIEILKQKNNEYPILLLDDIFSELDEKRRELIIKYIDDGIQTFITTTDLKNIKQNILKNANIYQIKRGEIFQKK